MEAKELYFLKRGFVPKYSRGEGRGRGVARWAARDRSGFSEPPSKICQARSKGKAEDAESDKL